MVPTAHPRSRRRSAQLVRRPVADHDILETLAAMSGDVDAEVAVLARDLSAAWLYVRIVHGYFDADRHGHALNWAESGLAAYDLAHVRLVEALADEYQHAGRGADAMRLPITH